jgi:hypothetical protein
VDWDTYFRERNMKKRLAAAAEIRKEEEKRRAEALKWKSAEETRGEEEQENDAQRKREEARIRKAAEREKAEKRRKAQEAERKASDVRVKRENEKRRLLAFGPPPGESEQPRQRTWTTPPTSSDSGSQARQVEKLAPLTEESLRAQATFGDDDLDPLGRGLGDNMRTILEGFRLPTILQSDLTPSDDEENPLDQNKDKYKTK